MDVFNLGPRVKVLATILFHSSCAISVTLVSKSALNGIDAPVVLLAFQTTVQVVLLTVVGMFMGWVKLRRPLSAWKAFVPLALARVVGVLAKTYCLAAVDASFYQIARGLLLPFTLGLSYLFLPSKYATFPPLALGGAGIVILGFGIGMVSDMNKMLTSSRGLVLGVGSSMTTAIESIVVKRFVGAKAKETGEGVIQMVWMSNVIAIGLYVPVLLFSGELNDPAVQALFASKTDSAIASGSSTILDSKNAEFLYTCTLTGLCSFLLTLATFLQIQITSPVTHMIVTAARGVAQSAIAVMLLPHETIDKGRIGSMACILGGSAIYGWAEDRAMVKREAEKAFAKTEEGIPMMATEEQSDQFKEKQ